MQPGAAALIHQTKFLANGKLLALGTTLLHCLVRLAVRARHSQFAGGHSGGFGDIRLQARPSSADRTQSPAAVSQKREFFKCPPETTGYFGRKMPQTGAWRLVPDSQKPAIGGLFCR
jgi:hypothetical protein